MVQTQKSHKNRTRATYNTHLNQYVSLKIKSSENLRKVCYVPTFYKKHTNLCYFSFDDFLLPV